MILSTKNIVTYILFIVLSSCGSKIQEPADGGTEIGTPVTVASVIKTELNETIELSATSAFLLKTPVKSVVTGYLQNVKIKQGDFVTKGEVLMNLVTKEAKILGSTIDNVDTSFHFKREINITAPGSGYISQLNFQGGDYVQDGEQIAVISAATSFVFILDLPYELTPLLKINKTVQIVLPDQSKLTGTIEKPMPTVEAASQTQSYLISINSDKMIPENLIAKVLLIKSAKQNVTAVPKEAVLTDETQSNFWIMKLLNDSTAVKITVLKGLEADGKVEILSPVLSGTDKIVVSGNYGLTDTAKVYLSK